MSIEQTLAERGSRYGEFADHAKIAQGIQDVLRAAPKWEYLDQDMKQALSVIADKIARILNGDPYYLDNWHDLSGYATLIENRLKLLDEVPDGLFEKEKVVGPKKGGFVQTKMLLTNEKGSEEVRYNRNPAILNGGQRI